MTEQDKVHYFQNTTFIQKKKHIQETFSISNKMTGTRKKIKTYAFFLSNQSVTSALQAANLASHSAVRVIVSLVDVLDEKAPFTPTEFTNAGFTAITWGIPLVGLPVLETARVHGNVLKYLVACIGQDQKSEHESVSDVYFPRP